MKEAKLFVENIVDKFNFNRIKHDFDECLPNKIGDYINPIKIVHTLTGKRGMFTTRRVN